MRTIATAGHVDHGKSALVRALTGTDPDRLVEEKARGLTIDLGFAFADLPSGRRIGFVDVPGHARFLSNMLAGAGAVDLALFVVAADEGWSAQSREHLQILDLLGAAGGVIAITKIDRVDPERLEAVTEEVRTCTRGTVFEHCTVVRCDSLHGDGLDDLRTALDRLLETASSPLDRGRPRLWIDRAFSVKGAGTVVTGTLEGGRLAVDQRVLLVNDDVVAARVRGLESAGRRIEVAEPGARVAVNLAGLERADVARGNVVVLEGQWHPTGVVDGRVRTEGPLPSSRVALQVHVGSAKLVGHLHVREGYGRLRLERAVPLVPGDRLLIRDPGRRSVVGSLEVLEIDPKGRLAPERLRVPVIEQRFLIEPWQRQDALIRATGLDEGTIDRELGRLVDREVVVSVVPWFVRRDVHGHAVTALVDAVSARPHSLMELAVAIGVSRDQLRSLVHDSCEFTLEHNTVRRLGAPATASSREGQKLLALLRSDPFSPPDPRGLSREPAVLRDLVREGEVTKCDDIWFATDALRHAAEIVDAELAKRSQLTVAELRDLFRSSRRYTLAIAGWLDAMRITRREGDVRVRGVAPVAGLPFS